MNSEKGLPRFAFRSANKAQNFVQKRISSLRSPSSNPVYKTRGSDGSLMTFKKTRYSPELPMRRKRHAAATNLNSSDTTEREQRRSYFLGLEYSDVSSDEGSVELTYEEPIPKRPYRMSNEKLTEDMKEEIQSEKRDDANPKTVETEYERQFKRAIRLYRYMALPDGDVLRPIYRPFLKRNLSYMKSANFTMKESQCTGNAAERRPQRDVPIRRANLRSMEQKRANIKSVLTNLHKKMNSSTNNSPVKEDWKLTKSMPSSLGMRRSLNDASGVENGEEIQSEKRDDANPKTVETEYERQFKRAIRLYRYMALPDGDVLRPIYRPFLKRNLSYMKSANFTMKESQCTGNAAERRPQRDVPIRRANLRSMEQKRANIKSVLTNLHKKMNSSTNNSPVKEDWKLTKSMPSSLGMRRSLNDASGVENGVSERERGSKHSNCSHSTSLLRFVDVRNNELPGSRHAMITVYLCTEIDGRFDEIVRIPSATVQMPVNNRSTPVNIDLPHGIGCPLDCSGKERNDYVIIRVTFSGEEDARVFGGRTLRGVPSRQAGKAEVKVTRRSVSNALSKKPVGIEDSAAVYGARCICSMGNTKHSPGIIYGDGSINLVPESLLGINDNWRRDGSLAKRIVELGKKVHESPFVHMSIMQDCGGETSSSEDDDETKSLSSESSSVHIRKEETVRQSGSAPKLRSCDEQAACVTAEDDKYDDYMKARYRHEMSLQFPKQICYRFIMKYNDQPNTTFPENKMRPVPDEPPCKYDDYMKARYRHEMSLQFPKQICYRFIMKYNDQPNTTFPENKMRPVPDEPPCVSAFAASPSKQPIRVVANKSDKQPKSAIWPLKEVSSANFLNGHAVGVKQRRSARIGSPSKAAVSAPKSSAAAPLKFRLDVPRRDSPLPEMIDMYAEQFDKCANIQSPKDDDRMATLEANNNNDRKEPEGNAVVTRLLSPSNKCFFCLGTFPDMFALLMHLRTCYPRLDIVYRGDVRSSAAANSSAPVYIDIFLRDNVDSSFEGPMIRQYVGLRNRIVPQRCTPSDRLTYIVYKSEARSVRHMPKDLSIFFTQSDREKRALRGNNAAYFGFRSRHPLMSSSQVPAKQLDQEWMRRMIIRQIEDFVDLSRPEKEFIKLWNLFVLDSNNRPFGWCHMYRTCRLFLEEHREELVAKDLRRAWVYHLAAFNEKDALDADETYDLTQRLNADYDPTSDKCHIVYRTRTCDEQPSTSTKRKTPAWQRAPIPGPKASILRSASVTSRLSSVGGPSSDSEEVLKKFPDDSSRDERRCSSCSTDDVTRHNSVRRHRESDLSKYLMTTLRVADRPSKWFSFDEDSAP
ncbi:Polycomb protein Su(z)12 [Toxocara canis]|uniref:Polycomb protein Su(Z)12 n=1 Tax=Toxocara canis TaxID=6265 RepID=A0A0B2UMM7_TOXCA|nr:Polycomb protein Su(z)12 [Toxocara canis]